VKVSPLYRGQRAEHPKIAPLMREFNDVLVSDFPDGLPPERRAAMEL
jgi:hypothetical protein